jgi:hypothetical protein
LLSSIAVILTTSKLETILKISRLQKNWLIYRILASTEKQADDRILAGVEIPAPGKKTSGTGKTGGPLTV